MNTQTLALASLIAITGIFGGVTKANQVCNVISTNTEGDVFMDPMTISSEGIHSVLTYKDGTPERYLLDSSTQTFEVTYYDEVRKDWGVNGNGTIYNEKGSYSIKDGNYVLVFPSGTTSVYEPNCLKTW